MTDELRERVKALRDSMRSMGNVNLCTASLFADKLDEVLSLVAASRPEPPASVVERIARQLNTWGREEWPSQPDDDWDDLTVESKTVYRERATLLIALGVGDGELAKLREAVVSRAIARKAVKDWMDAEGKEGRFRLNGNAPGWPAYEESEKRLREVIEEVEAAALAPRTEKGETP